MIILIEHSPSELETVLSCCNKYKHVLSTKTLQKGLLLVTVAGDCTITEFQELSDYFHERLQNTNCSINIQ